MKKLRIGIIGCGAIGSRIAIECSDRLSGIFDLAGLCDVAEVCVFSFRALLVPFGVFSYSSGGAF